MIKRCILLLALCYCFTTIKSQSALDTIKACLKHKPQLFGKLDSRHTFISNNNAKVFGCKAGLSYNKRLHFGLGYNQLYPPSGDFDMSVYYTTINNKRDSVTAALKLFYISSHAEYAYYQTKNWNLSILLQLGVGKTYYQYSLFGKKNRINQSMIFIYEPAISVEYKIVKWVGVGVDAGFRFTLTDYRNVNEKFNSPTYAFKLLIYYNEIYKSISTKIKEKL